MDLYFDRDNKNFVYTDYKAKFIISPAREIKLRNTKIIRVAFVTAVNNIKPVEFTMKKYKKYESFLRAWVSNPSTSRLCGRHGNVIRIFASTRFKLSHCKYNKNTRNRKTYKYLIIWDM